MSNRTWKIDWKNLSTNEKGTYDSKCIDAQQAYQWWIANHNDLEFIFMHL